MDWVRYVRSGEVVPSRRSNGFYLNRVMLELLEQNTLAKWVSETNDKKSQKA